MPKITMLQKWKTHEVGETWEAPTNIAKSLITSGTACPADSQETDPATQAEATPDAQSDALSGEGTVPQPDPDGAIDSDFSTTPAAVPTVMDVPQRFTRRRGIASTIE